MDPDDLEPEELHKFIREVIVAPNPEYFKDPNAEIVLRRICTLHSEIFDKYTELSHWCNSYKHPAKLLFEHLEMYPKLESKDGSIASMLSYYGIDPYVTDSTGEKMQRSKVTNKRSRDSIFAVTLIKEYIDEYPHPPYNDCPKPPSSELDECVFMMVNPECGLKEKYKDSPLEDAIQILYNASMATARSRSDSANEDSSNPNPGQIKQGLKARIDSAIRSYKKSLNTD
jgi:hypothetical protein